ncbi:MAG: rod-binding protein [Proteobacteria bacterium]|nr:rod-binding protein [Pseudomonadota bacterium]
MGLDTPIIDLSQIANTARAGQAERAAARLRGPLADDQVRRAAEEFEAVFISQMLAPMFEGLETDELFGGGPGEDIYRSILVEEYGKAIARSGGIGIADAVQREILRLQEVSQE